MAALAKLAALQGLNTSRLPVTLDCRVCKHKEEQTEGMEEGTYVYAATAWIGLFLRWLGVLQQGHLLTLKSAAPLVELLQSEVASSSGCKLSYPLGQCGFPYMNLGHNLTTGKLQACKYTTVSLCTKLCSISVPLREDDYIDERHVHVSCL